MKLSIDLKENVLRHHILIRQMCTKKIVKFGYHRVKKGKGKIAHFHLH